MKKTKQEKKETKILFQKLSVKDETKIKGGGEVPGVGSCTVIFVPDIICPS